MAVSKKKLGWYAHRRMLNLTVQRRLVRSSIVDAGDAQGKAYRARAPRALCKAIKMMQRSCPAAKSCAGDADVAADAGDGSFKSLKRIGQGSWQATGTDCSG